MTISEAVTRLYSGPEHQPFQFGEGAGGALLIHGFPGTPAEVWGIGGALSHEAPPDKLVLIAPFWRLPGLLPSLVPLLRLVMLEMRPFKDADFDVPEFRAGPQRLMPEADLDDPQLQAYVREEITLPLVVIHDVFRLGGQAYRRAGPISVPTLVIPGREDATARPDLTRKLAQRLGSEWVSYHELSGGHKLIHAHAEQSPHVSKLILEYVRGQR